MFENSLNINAPKFLNVRVTLSINHCQLKMRRKMNKDDKCLLLEKSNNDRNLRL